MTQDNIPRIVSSDTLRDDRIPPGQHVVDGWPILHEGKGAQIDLSTWTFRVFGLVEEEKSWTWDEFRKMPVSEVFADWHCVTTWSILGITWTGVTARDVLSGVKILPEAKAVMVHTHDGYSTNLDLNDFLEEDVIFAWAEGSNELPHEKGGPMRLVVPKLYAWKSAKWTSAVEFIAENRPGYWEERGYHMRGDPWTQERRG